MRICGKIKLTVNTTRSGIPGSITSNLEEEMESIPAGSRRGNGTQIDEVLSERVASF